MAKASAAVHLVTQLGDRSIRYRPHQFGQLLIVEGAVAQGDVVGLVWLAEGEPI